MNRNSFFARYVASTGARPLNGARWPRIYSVFSHLSMASDVNQVVVPAHGATPDHVEESDFDGHMLADKELSLGDQKRSVVNDSVGERHHVGEAGLDVAKRRSAAIESNRKASAAIFDSDKLSVCPEQKGRKRK